MTEHDFGVEFPSTRPDGVGLLARLDLKFAEIGPLPEEYNVRYSDIRIPYVAIGVGDIILRRIYVGTAYQANEMPRLRSNMLVSVRTQKDALHYSRKLSILLHNFRVDGQSVSVSRPISATSGYGAYGRPNETFDALLFSAHEPSGNCVLEGNLQEPDGAFTKIEISSLGDKYPFSDPMDAYRFGNRCLGAIGAPGQQPLISFRKDI